MEGLEQGRLGDHRLACARRRADQHPLIRREVGQQGLQLNSLVGPFRHAKIDLADAVYQPYFVFVRYIQIQHSPVDLDHHILAGEPLG